MLSLVPCLMLELVYCATKQLVQHQCTSRVPSGTKSGAQAVLQRPAVPVGHGVATFLGVFCAVECTAVCRVQWQASCTLELIPGALERAEHCCTGERSDTPFSSLPQHPLEQAGGHTCAVQVLAPKSLGASL